MKYVITLIIVSAAMSRPAADETNSHCKLDEACCMIAPSERVNT